MKFNQFTPKDEEPLLAAINVTPIVDVILTVLIIFILIAPIMEQGITLNLPKATAEKIDTKDTLTIDVDKNGQIYLDTTPVSLIVFQERIKAIASFNKDQAVLIRADEANKYGDIVGIIDTIKQAGLHKMGILTSPKEK